VNDMLARDDTERLADLIAIAEVPAGRAVEAAEWISGVVEALRSGGRAKFAKQCGSASDWNRRLSRVDRAAARLDAELRNLPPPLHLALAWRIELAAPARVRRAVARARRPNGGRPANLTVHLAADLALKFFRQFSLIEPTSDSAFVEFIEELCSIALSVKVDGGHFAKEALRRGVK
jgi:hypothetical protein